MKDIDEEPLLSQVYMVGDDPPVLVEELDRAVLHGDLLVQGDDTDERLRASDWVYLDNWR